MRDAKDIALSLLKEPKYRRRPSTKATVEEAFLHYGYIEDSATGCWLWQGPVNSMGYGYFKRGKIVYRAHRYSLSRTVGYPEDPTLSACHTCDNRICINPQHLWFDTHKNNMADAAKKGRYSKHCAKLSTEDVLAIRNLVAQGITQREVASMYSISYQQVSRIVRHENWF